MLILINQIKKQQIDLWFLAYLVARFSIRGYILTYRSWLFWIPRWKILQNRIRKRNWIRKNREIGVKTRKMGLTNFINWDTIHFTATHWEIYVSEVVKNILKKVLTKWFDCVILSKLPMQHRWCESIETAQSAGFDPWQINNNATLKILEE